jgi:hypothetical protein
MHHLAAILVALAACTRNEPTPDPASPQPTEPRDAGRVQRCSAVCAREAACAATSFDAKECTSACMVLANDPASAKHVEQHLACVEATSECTAALACK